MFSPDSPGYYQFMMANFDVFAYDSPDNISSVIKKKTNDIWAVRWGPVALYSDFDVIYSLMYVAVEKITGAVAVIIRGTTWDSLETWLKQDFKIHYQLQYKAYDPNAPANALIAQGTCNGLNDLLSMQDSSRGNIRTGSVSAQKVSNVLLATRPSCRKSGR